MRWEPSLLAMYRSRSPVAALRVAKTIRAPVGDQAGAKQPNDPAVSHDWKEYAGSVKIPEKARKIQIALQIYGPGKVWFDDVRAIYTEEKGPPAP